MKKTYIILLEYSSLYNTEDNGVIVAMLASIGHVLQLSEHAFIMASADSAVVIRDAIKNSPYEIGRIFVAEVSSPAAWRNLISDNNELKSILRNEY